MRFETQQFCHPVSVERQIHPGAQSDLQHASFSQTNDPLSIDAKQAVPHRQVDQTRKDMVLIKGHRYHRTTRIANLPRCDAMSSASTACIKDNPRTLLTELRVARSAVGKVLPPVILR